MKIRRILFPVLLLLLLVAVLLQRVPKSPPLLRILNEGSGLGHINGSYEWTYLSLTGHSGTMACGMHPLDYFTDEKPQ